MQPTIVLLDPIHEDGIPYAAGKAALVKGYELDPADRDRALADADAVVVRTARADAPLPELARNLKVVAKHGAGVDNIDIPAMTRAGIVVVNTPGMANATAVAEGALTLALAVLKKTFFMDRAVREGKYALRSSVRGGDLWERTVGIVGIGNIGTHVARICGKGFNMRVVAYDPYLTAEEIGARGAVKVEDLRALLEMSDVVTLHTPLTPETNGMIGAAEFAAMKPTAIIVNTARGPVIDEAALADALRTKKIAGAGIDVFREEPPAPDNPLFALRDVNIVVSPHNAGLTEEAMRQLAIRTIDTAMEVLAGRKPATILNPEVWKRRRSAAAVG